MAIFFRKIARIAQWLGASPPGPYLSNLAFSNCSKNVQNVIQMTLKWLFFSEKLQELPSGWDFAPGPYISNLPYILAYRSQLFPYI